MTISGNHVEQSAHGRACVSVVPLADVQKPGDKLFLYSAVESSLRIWGWALLLSDSRHLI